MRVIKRRFIHNQIIFDEAEKDVLTTAYKIVDAIRMENIHSSGADDDYLTEKCDDILKGISELLDNYTNEYLDK